MQWYLRGFIPVVLAAAATLAAGCAQQPILMEAVAQAEELNDTESLQREVTLSPQEYRIESGDKLEIKFYYNPDLNEEVTVRPDGRIALQLIDEVQVAGHTPAQLDELLTSRYAGELKRPEITVLVRTFTSHRIYVGGEVNQEGMLDLSARMTTLQAVINAGGFRETAMPEGVIVIRKGIDNRPVAILANLNNTLHGDPAFSNIQLQPQDIVYVPKSSIARANKWVDQYVRQLFLFNGVNFGFNYQLNDNVTVNN